MRFIDKYSDWKDPEVTVDTPYDASKDKFILIGMDEYLDTIDLEGYTKEDYIKMFIR